MKYLFTLLLFFFSFLSFGQTSCLDAVANSTGLMGEFIPQCEDDGSYSPMQCWSSTGYCWCVDENGIEISGTSLGPGQGTPDCGGGVDCIDDPGDMLTQYGFSCPELATLGCDADLSDFIPEIGFGISVYEICPESCTDCGENDCIDDPDGMLTQYGFDCGELTILGCDADLSDFIPEIGFGISVYEICPESCTDCGEEEEGCTLSDGSNVPNGWSGFGVGDNWCNSCFCDNGDLSCTEMDCGGNNDCIDDPDGMLTQYGFDCGELTILGCDADLSDFIPEIGFGISVYEICPESCTDCGEENVIIGELFNKKKLLKTIDFLGREINSHTEFQLHIYDDGSVEKKYILK